MDLLMETTGFEPPPLQQLSSPPDVVPTLIVNTVYYYLFDVFSDGGLVNGRRL